MNRYILICLVLFFIGQTLVWLQLNGQFVWPIFKKYEWVVALFGIPISYVFLEATRCGYVGFDELLWPQRILVFSVGVVVFALLTWWYMGEAINTKTLISLMLAGILVLIQIFWK